MYTCIFIYLDQRSTTRPARPYAISQDDAMPEPDHSPAVSCCTSFVIDLHVRDSVRVCCK